MWKKGIGWTRERLAIFKGLWRTKKPTTMHCNVHEQLTTTHTFWGRASTPLISCAYTHTYIYMYRERERKKKNVYFRYGYWIWNGNAWYGYIVCLVSLKNHSIPSIVFQPREIFARPMRCFICRREGAAHLEELSGAPRIDTQLGRKKYWLVTIHVHWAIKIHG